MEHFDHLEDLVRRFNEEKEKQLKASVLRALPTEDLIAELTHREGVEFGNVGLYQKFDLKQKYSNDRTRIADAAVLIIHHFVF